MSSTINDTSAPNGSTPEVEQTQLSNAPGVASTTAAASVEQTPKTPALGEAEASSIEQALEANGIFEIPEGMDTEEMLNMLNPEAIRNAQKQRDAATEEKKSSTDTPMANADTGATKENQASTDDPKAAPPSYPQATDTLSGIVSVGESAEVTYEKWDDLCLHCSEDRKADGHASSSRDCKNACVKCGSKHEFRQCSQGSGHIDQFKLYQRGRSKQIKNARAEAKRAEKAAAKGAAGTQGQGNKNGAASTEQSANAGNGQVTKPANGASTANADQAPKAKKTRSKNKNSKPADKTSDGASKTDKSSKQGFAAQMREAQAAKDKKIADLEQKLHLMEFEKLIRAEEQQKMDALRNRMDDRFLEPLSKQQPFFGRPLPSRSVGMARGPQQHFESHRTIADVEYESGQIGDKRRAETQLQPATSNSSKPKLGESSPAKTDATMRDILAEEEANKTKGSEESESIVHLSSEMLKQDYHLHGGWKKIKNTKGDEIFHSPDRDTIKIYLPPGWQPFQHNESGARLYVYTETLRGVQTASEANQIYRSMNDGADPPPPEAKE